MIPRCTQAGWVPTPGAEVYVWATQPDWGGEPADITIRWTNPVRFVGSDSGYGDQGPRWLVGDRHDPSLLLQTRSNLVEAAPPAQLGLW